MKKLLISLLAALSLLSGYAVADQITVLSKKTVGVEHAIDFRVRIFRLCVSGQEFVQTHTICPLKGYSTSELEQIYEEKDGRLLPKKCQNR